MKKWFTSDNHFWHKNIMKFCPETRKFNTVEEMNRGMIARWQEQVAPEDEVYILGDVFFCHADEAERILQQLPGRKHLILGNHDQVIRDNAKLRDHFESIHEYRSITVDGIKVVLFHFPIVEYDKMHYGSYHLYGHVHGKYQHPGRAMDVGIDTRTDNGLWSWDEVNAILSKRPIMSHH